MNIAAMFATEQRNQNREEKAHRSVSSTRSACTSSSGTVYEEWWNRKVAWSPTRLSGTISQGNASSSPRSDITS